MCNISNARLKDIVRPRKTASANQALDERSDIAAAGNGRKIVKRAKKVIAGENLKDAERERRAPDAAA